MLQLWDSERKFTNTHLRLCDNDSKKELLRLIDSFLCGQRVGEAAATPPGDEQSTENKCKAGRARGKRRGGYQ